MASGSHRPRWRSIRLRTALSATLVVAIALVAASVGLVLLQRHQLTQGLAEVAEDQAELVADLLEHSRPTGSELEAIAAGDDAVVQILSATGEVIAASDDDLEKTPLTDRRPASEDPLVFTVPAIPDEDEPFVVVVLAAEEDSERLFVVAVQSLESVEDATEVTTTLLAVGVPLVLIVVAATSYLTAGRALAPVEQVRSRVAAISPSDELARVPVPDTGDEIERLAVTMNEMLERLQAAAAEQRRFIADSSHELRTPLATIHATMELAKLHPEALPLEGPAAIVLAETERLERLVGDLLLLARTDEHGLVMRITDVDLDDIVTGEIARLRAGGGPEILVDVRHVRVRGDAQHLLRVVRNLFDNAARYAEESVHVRLFTEDDQAVLEVTDDGPGIPKDDWERVFDRFVRLDASRDRGTGGTGLGLAITRQIASAHGGSVRVTATQDGHGTRMRLTLPLPG